MKRSGSINSHSSFFLDRAQFFFSFVFAISAENFSIISDCNFQRRRHFCVLASQQPTQDSHNFFECFIIFFFAADNLVLAASQSACPGQLTFFLNFHHIIIPAEKSNARCQPKHAVQKTPGQLAFFPEEKNCPLTNGAVDSLPCPPNRQTNNNPNSPP